MGSGKTLRELVVDGAGGLVSSVELIGTPDEVADRMGEIMEEVGGDGFMITTPLLRLNRRYITEVTEGLVPALQRRGLTRSAYTRARPSGRTCWSSDAAAAVRPRSPGARARGHRALGRPTAPRGVGGTSPSRRRIAEPRAHRGVGGTSPSSGGSRASPDRRAPAASAARAAPGAAPGAPPSSVASPSRPGTKRAGSPKVSR
ncbi:hypothetical protein NKH77_15540 [Streptomyces sp. M19]